MTTQAQPEPEPLERLHAKLLRDVLATERFDSFADLKDALKARAARLGLPYDAEVVSRAVDLVGSNRALLASDPPTRRGRPDHAGPDHGPVPQATAVSILRELQRRTGLAVEPRAIPPAPSAEDRRRQRIDRVVVPALRIHLQAIAEVAQVVDDLENHPPERPEP